MRGLAVASLLLALTTVSGCVEFVDGTEPNLDDAAQEAQDLLADYQETAGHIAGTIRDTDGAPLMGAIVDLVGFNHSALTDPDGGFAFLDLVPNVYSLRAVADGYLEIQSDVNVSAGTFARPTLQLDAAPDEPYTELYLFDGYSQLSVGPFRSGVMWCSCGVEMPVSADLVDLVFEGELDATFLGSDDLDYWLYNETELLASGTEHSPMRIQIPAEDLGNSTVLYAYLEPSQHPLTVRVDEWFRGYVTLFYGEGSPEGYSVHDA